MVVAVVMAVVDGRGGCGWCYECFLDSEIYYFIVGDILFYYDIYIILLHWKIKLFYCYSMYVSKIDKITFDRTK